MGDVTKFVPPIPGFLEGRDLERAVDRVIEHHVSELEKQVGPDDEYVKFMKATQRTAMILAFPQPEAPDPRKE